MRLLIITQTINEEDSNLGFFHAWIAEFAKHCESVTAIGLSVGTFHLPKNVRIFSLGKEHGVSRFTSMWNFYRLIFRERKNYDAVFVHMNPEYVILGWIPWKMIGKKIGLWYTHKHVDIKLRLATWGTDLIFTASKESFRLTSPKCHVVGHGTDMTRFQAIKRVSGAPFRICSLGRLSRSKDYGVLLRALESLQNAGVFVETTIIGDSITEDDKAYAKELKTEVARRGLDGKAVFVGGIPNSEIAAHLAQADLFVNMSRTGSLDKAVLEAMASGIPVLTSNEGLRTTLVGFEEACLFNEGDEKDFAAHIRSLMNMSEGERKELGEKLREIVEKNHNLKTLIPRIVTMLRPTI